MKILKAADISLRVPGGVHSFMVKSGAALADQGNSVDYIFREDLAPSAIPQPLRRFIVPWLLTVRVLHRRREKYDVVEIHEPDAAVYCFIGQHLAWLRLPPCVVITYGPLERRWRAERERYRALGRRRSLKDRISAPLTLLPQSRYAFRNADHVLVSSGEDGEYVCRELGVRQDRVGYAYSGVGDAYFQVRRNQPSGGQTKMVFIGTWIDRKGVRELVEAWSMLAERMCSPTLTLLATVTREDEVLECFNSSRDRIVVRPLISEAELIEQLAQHDVFLLPAWFEGGTPLALLQAAAAGLACVVTSIGGNTDVFRPEDPAADGALLMPPHDSDALAASLERLVSDRQLIERLGANARNRARSFSWRATGEQALCAYRAAIERSEARTARKGDSR